MSELKMSEEFRSACEGFRITDELLAEGLKRSQVTPQELLFIDSTTSPRNFKVKYVNKAGEPKWVHLFVVVPPATG